MNPISRILTLSAVVMLSASVSAQSLPSAVKTGRKLPKIKAEKVRPLAGLGPMKEKLQPIDAPAPLGKPFAWAGEELYYAVEVGGTDAARASLQAGKKKTKKGVTYVPVVGRAITHGFFAKSYPMDNKADTFIDTATFQPIKSDKKIKEKGDWRRYTVRYDPGRYGAKVDREVKKKGKKKKNKKYTRAVPNTIHDGISWLYALRTQPLAQGDVYDYYIYDGWKLSLFRIKVVGRQSVWTPLQEYKTVKLDIERTVLNSRWKIKDGVRTAPVMTPRQKPYYLSSIYLSDDDARIPVKIFVTTEKADSVLKLVKYVPPKK